MVEGLVGRDNHSADEAKSVFVSPSWWHSMWYVAYCRQVNSLYDYSFIYTNTDNLLILLDGLFSN